MHFSPKDGLLASASADKTVKIWSVDKGKAVETIKKKSSDATAALFSLDGRYLAVARRDGTLWIHDTSSWEEIRPLGRKGEPIYALAFSPDGRLLASAGRDKTVKIWDALTGRKIITLSGHEESVHAVCFTPDGKFLVSGSRDRTVKIWNPALGTTVRTLEGHEGAVHALAFSPDQRFLVSGGGDNVLKVWNALEVYAGNVETPLRNGEGRLLGNLPIRTPMAIEASKIDSFRVRVNENLKGWVSAADVSFDKPDISTPVVQVVSKPVDGSKLYLKGIAFSEEEITSVRVAGLELTRIRMSFDKKIYGDVFAFEEIVPLSSGTALTLTAQDRNGRFSETPLRP